MALRFTQRYLIQLHGLYYSHDEKTHKKVWDLFLKLTPGEEYSPTINVYGNTWPCYDMNTIVVQGYDSSGFEEGYFSDDFSLIHRSIDSRFDQLRNLIDKK